jgi:hypothetical protein
LNKRSKIFIIRILKIWRIFAHPSSLKKHFPAQIHWPTRAHSSSFHHRLQESIPNAAENLVGVPCPAAQKHPTPINISVTNSEERIILDYIGAHSSINPNAAPTTTLRSCLKQPKPLNHRVSSMPLGWRANTQCLRYPPTSHLVTIPLHEHNNVNIVTLEFRRTTQSENNIGFKYCYTLITTLLFVVTIAVIIYFIVRFR